MKEEMSSAAEQAFSSHRARFAPPPCLPPPLLFTSPCAQTISSAAALHQIPTQPFPPPQSVAFPWTAGQTFGHSASPYSLPFHPSQLCCHPYISFCCCSCGFGSCPCFFYASPCPGTTNCFALDSSRSFAAQGSEWKNDTANPGNDAGTSYEEQNLAYDRGQACPNLDQSNDLQHKECERDVEEDDPQFVLTDEWAEFFAKSEARRREKKTQLKKKKQAASKEVRLSPQQQKEEVPKSVRSSEIGGSLNVRVTPGVE